jgi:O-antigen/teichoic acid export membrane protein
MSGLSEPTQSKPHPAEHPTPPDPPAVAPSRPRSLRVNLLFAVFGTGIFTLCRFGVMVLMAKFGSARIVGTFSHCMNLSNPVVMSTRFGLRTVLIADAENITPFGTYLRARFLWMGVAALVMVPIAIHEFREDFDVAFLVMLAGVTLGKIADSVGELFWGLFQKGERMDLVAYSNCLRGVIMIVPFAVVAPICWWLVRRGTLSESTLAYAIGAAAVLYAIGWCFQARYYDAKIGSRSEFHRSEWSWSGVRYVSRTGLPLGITFGLIALKTSLPRFVIEDQPNGKEALGYFTALAWIIQAGQLLTTQLGHTAANRLSVTFRDGRGKFLRLLTRLLLTGLCMGVATFAAALLLGRWALSVLFDADYAAYYSEFLIMVVAQMFMFISSLLGFATTQMRLFWIQVPVLTAMCLAGWIVALIFVPEAPVRGGAYALLATAIVQLLLLAACTAYGVINREKLLARAAAEQQAASTASE